MVRPSTLSIALSAFVLTLLLSQSSFSSTASLSCYTRDQQPEQDQVKKGKKEKKRARRVDEKGGKQKEPQEAEGTDANAPAGSEEEVNLVSDSQSAAGDVVLCEGYVNATQGETRLQADRVTFNKTTGDMVAEGNVIFDQGTDQRVTAKRAEINWKSKRGVFWDTTGFTNRTQTGDYIFFTAERVEKTGPDTYELFNARVTACEDVIPKWVFTTRRAELKMNDRLKLYRSVFRVKDVPAFVLPYAWIPATRTQRKSGFLIPTSGTSNAKGRTFKVAYYQTLGQSADITFRSDVYTSRGIGTGAEFRAQTSDDSFMRLGVFTVKDRLFGPPGENQGGTAFVAEGVQYLPHGWLAVGNVSLVTSLAFRQVFSDDISQVVDPRRESSFYATNNARYFSFNLLASNETTTLHRPSASSSEAGTDFDVKIRQAPQIDMLVYPHRISSRLPIYFSLDTSLGALKREETVAGSPVLNTPAAVQRFDLQPKITVALATFAGIAVTPSLALRETFYTSSFDPRVPVFDPDRFSLAAADPRLDPTSPIFKPGLTFFDISLLNPIVPVNVSRHYAELAVDVRPPSLEREFLNDDGSRRFKHVIEPYFTYRTIRGIGDEFNNIIRFDDRDAVANTNEFEYAIVNRFFTNRRVSDFDRKRSRNRQNQPSEMEPLSPEGRKGDRSGAPDGKGVDPGGKAAAGTPEKPSSTENTQPVGDQQEKKQKLESGKQADMAREDERRQRSQSRARGDKTRDTESREADDAQEAATNEDSPAQPYELLSIKVAQKYFFDRKFGGALVEGQRNQFYPINTLSGFTYGGQVRSFSPANIQVRYRPLSSIYGDVRMDIGAGNEVVRNVTVSAGLDTDKVSVKTRWYFSRRIDVDATRFEAGTFPGNQLVTIVQFGNEAEGVYAGTRIDYDFTDRFVTTEQISRGRLRHSRSYIGYGWDCCGVQFNYNTFKAGLRNESAFSFTFTLAGLGSFGSDQFSQLGGGQGGRKRGKKMRRDRYDDY
ncbi:MAG TPA: putative LPS assembly protein LptD [Blastocatellia bacterium]|nr:putative LPS assembly protein LptD [Blastocatellia bacterium]